MSSQPESTVSPLNVALCCDSMRTASAASAAQNALKRRDTPKSAAKSK